MTIEIQQNDGGSYTIFPAGKTAHSATGFIRRNETGGGYTLTMKDGRSATFRNMPASSTWSDLEADIASIIETAN